MTALQKVNLGTAPAGSDGDAVRTAFVKDNANVDVLNSQTFLTSATLVTTAQALTTAHIGKRVNINLSVAGTINLPAASTCAVDQVTLLRNTGTTVVTLAITTGSGDTVSVSKLNPGETALMDTDGVHTWTCLMRGRTNSDNETVNANLSLTGASARITGDFSNATPAARTLFRTSTANTYTNVGLVANGTGNESTVSLFGGSDASNASSLYVGCLTGTAYISASRTGTGIVPSLAFLVGGATRLSISTSGVVSIGSGLPIIDFLTVAGAVNSSAGYRCRQGSSGAVSNLFNIFYTSNTAYLYIDTTNIGAFSYASDERVKQDITDLPITGFIDRVSQMRVINYQWADAGLFKSDGVVRQGFSANNLYAIKPGLVDGTPDGLTEDGKIQPMTINTTSLLSEVVGALKEATEVIQALSSRVAALEAK